MYDKISLILAQNALIQTKECINILKKFIIGDL